MEFSLYRNFSIYKNKKKNIADNLSQKSALYSKLVATWLNYYKDYFHKGSYKNEPKWDRVFVTTLFTFYWDITIETIEFAKIMVKDPKDLMVGGVMATIQAKEIETATGIKPYKGTLNKPGQLDKENTDIIDELPLDYSIIDEIDYCYPESNAYYGYSTRGCIRKCPFCAVPILEPNFEEYLPLAEKTKQTAELYGEQRNLLLMDNNVLASPKFPQIIEEIKASGFTKDAKYIEPNFFEIALRNLINGVNDAAYIRKLFYLIIELENKISNFDKKKGIFNIREQLQLLKIETATKDNVIYAATSLAGLYEKHRSKMPKQRYVDFNQGVDARKFTLENVELLSQIPIRPLRIAFDDIKGLPDYEKAIRWSVDAGIKDFSNYLLYNFKDRPIELYQRLKFNVDLCEEYRDKNINIYSFPMKYHPILGESSHNRDFIGEFWNRKYIRSVQAILNSTKGKVGRGLSFFEKAFGHNEEEFSVLLEMPETFILYRYFFEWLEEVNWEAVEIIHNYDFSNIKDKSTNPRVLNILKYYVSYRSDIITPGTELYKLKQQYDLNPTISLKRKNKLL